MSDDGFAWIQQDLASWGFSLEAVKGVGVEELAVMRGADPGLGIMAPDAFDTALRRSGNVPDRARLGEHARGGPSPCAEAATVSPCSALTM